MIRSIPTLLGIPQTDSRFKEVEAESAINQLIYYCKFINGLSLNTAYLGITSLLFLFLLRYLRRNYAKRYPFCFIIPNAALLVVLTTIFSFSFSFNSRLGIETLAVIQDKFPTPALPYLDWQFISRNLFLCSTIVLFGFFESISLVREFGMKKHCFPSGDRVLFGIGFINIVGSIFGGYSTFASLSRSKAQSQAGSQTMLTSLFTPIFIFIVLYTFIGVFQYLPLATLSCIVFEAAFKLIPFKQIAFTLKKRNAQEISKFFLAYVFTICLSPDKGVIVCLVLSALVIIRRSTAINVSILGEIENESGVHYVDIKEQPSAFLIAQIVPLIIRGSLEYFNAARISRRVEMLTDAVSKLARTEEENDHLVVQSAIRNSSLFISRDVQSGVYVILDFTDVDSIDSSAAWELKRLVEKSEHDKILFCGLGGSNQRMLDFLNPTEVFDTFNDALEFVKEILYGESVHSSENISSVRSLRQLRQQEGSFTDGLDFIQLSIRSNNQNQYSVRSHNSQNELSVRSRPPPTISSKPNLRTLFTPPVITEAVQSDEIIVMKGGASSTSKPSPTE